MIGTLFIFHLKEEVLNIIVTKFEPDLVSSKVQNVVPNVEVDDVL